jgi:murein DD-endopeptidase MepM/ murein hydrolase activator NlpD
VRTTALIAPALALAALAALVPASTAQAPARAHAEARVAAGDLGTIGRVVAAGDARRRAGAGAAEDGLEIAAGRTTARASRRGGAGRARATARAEDVVLFGGLVTARVVERTAVAADDRVTYFGAVEGLVVAGEDLGDATEPAVHPFEGGEATVNTDGDGLRVALTADRDGFAAGTTVSVAAVVAEAADGADPAATPTPTPAPSPEPTPAATPEPAPRAERPARGERRRARARAAARRLARGRFAFPIHGEATVADDFGAPRQIGAHQGNDVFAPFGSPVLAVADGTIERVGTLPISGNRLWLRTRRGDAYFYAHLSAFAPDAVDGRRVRAGTLLGFVGNTGDAEPTPPHVHFEIHPGGGRAIDPHAVLLAWQRDGLAPAGDWLSRYGDDRVARPGALVEIRDFIAGE